MRTKVRNKINTLSPKGFFVGNTYQSSKNLMIFFSESNITMSISHIKTFLRNCLSFRKSCTFSYLLQIDLIFLYEAVFIGQKNSNGKYYILDPSIHSIICPMYWCHRFLDSCLAMRPNFIINIFSSLSTYE